MRVSALTPALAAIGGLLTLAACTPAEDTASSDPAPTSTGTGVSAPGEWSETLIDAPTKPEDLIELGSGTVFLSAMSDNPGDTDGGAGSLQVLDPESDTFRNVWTAENITLNQDTETFSSCPGPLDPAVAAPHGLGTETAPDGTEYLYVVNHGGRESIEVFTVDDAALTWVGCSVLPEATMGNGVVADPDGEGFYVTNFLDPADMLGNFERAFAGEATGTVLHWTPESGWETLAGSELSTPNGIALSPDGDSLYVASWGGRELVELDRAGAGVQRSVEVDLLPDNLRYAADGSLLLTGQMIDTFEEFVSYEAEGLAPVDRHDILALDPEDFTVRTVAEGSVAGFGNPTTALEVGDRIYVGSVAGQKVLRLDPA